MATDGFIMNGYISAGPFSADEFVNPAFADEDATEDPHKTPAPANMTMSNLHVDVGTNTRSDASTARLRIAGANGNLAASITSSTTGVFGDTSNTDVLTQADLINYMWDLGGGTGNLEVQAASMERSA